MLRTLVIGVVLLSIGMLVWQADFAVTKSASRFEVPVEEPLFDGVPGWITEKAPVVAAGIDAIQSLFRPKQDEDTSPKIRRGAREARDNFDIRYTRRPD